MSTPKEIFETQIAGRIQEDMAKAKSINAVYKFVVSGDNGGTWIVNCKDSPGVTAGDAPADLTVSVAGSDLSDIIDGKLNPQMAFMSGKIKIQGNMALAMKLGEVLKTG